MHESYADGTRVGVFAVFDEIPLLIPLDCLAKY